MKKLNFIFLASLLLLLCSTCKCFAQGKSDTSKTKNSGRTYILTKTDDGVYTGKIISKDEKEIVIDDKNLGRVAIPMYMVKELKPVDKEDIDPNGQVKNTEIFATRYFLTSNGLPIKKGESYLVWNLFGVDFETNIGNNFSVGAITTWIGLPIIGNAKFSMELAKDVHLGVGGLIGTGSFWFPKFGFAMPYAALTFGDRNTNITFSGAYGEVWGIGDGNANGHLFASISAMTKISRKISLVFESLILPATAGDNDYNTMALFIPGLRFQTGERSSFQAGFAGALYNGVVYPIPIPFVQWYRML